MPDLEELILPAISCPFDIEKGTRGGIRVRLLKDLVEVEVRHANGEAAYGDICSREQAFVNTQFQPFFALVAQNTEHRVNDIDILAIYVKNLDDTKYTDKASLEQEKLKLLL